ncbi:hypothetical protein HPB50_019498 [Hyalomma asiaticum]|uniref:Uncharacterized protein n=1 Tax=Hyalomma asiaticum TaxID=266040 RepID=A0ACB7S6G0_HYAAI|nr:hypothetical protein HPB50_019498 [Hyalomma asiaticum]
MWRFSCERTGKLVSPASTISFWIPMPFDEVCAVRASVKLWQTSATDLPDTDEDAVNTTAASDAPEITIFRTDSRSDKAKFLEAVRSARKLWNGDYMYQRDIRITKAQLAHIYGVDTSKDETHYAWPNATVPYTIGRKVRGFEREILDAMRQWEQETCVHFVEMTENNGNTDHIHFVQSRCATFTSSVMHSVYGTRMPTVNRDTLYHVAWDKVPERYRYNFDHESPSYGSRTKVAALESEFEFDWSSVMADESESVEDDVDFMLQDRRVIYPSDPFYLYRTTSTEHASFLEYKKVNQLYKCNGTCRRHTCHVIILRASRCQHGGYLGPKCNCVCPPGAVGDRCEHMTINAKTDICGEVLQENKTIHFVSRPSSYHCTWWIRAPQGEQASVTFTDLSADNSTHSVGSCDLYFQLRNRDLYNGERYCWYELPLDEPLLAKQKDLLVDYFGSKDANFNFTLTATVHT